MARHHYRVTLTTTAAEFAHVPTSAGLVADFFRVTAAIDYARWLSGISGGYAEVTRPSQSEVFAQFTEGKPTPEFAHLG